MRLSVFLTVVFSVLHFSSCIVLSDYKLYSLIPTEHHQLKFLKSLDNEEYISVVFWRKPVKLFYRVEVLVKKSDEEMFLDRIGHFGFRTSLTPIDVLEAFNNQTVTPYDRFNDFSWEAYHTQHDIEMWLQTLAEKYPQHLQLQSLGKTVEGREILAASIKRSKRENLPNIIIEGGIHGHEWISIAFVTYIVNELLNNTTPYGLLKSVWSNYHWHLIPMVNPDGFNYTFTQDRLWRKNKGDSNHGVDLNRNFNYSFGRYGTSLNPVDDYYCGTEPFSELETRALSNFIISKARNLKYYFSIHSYGEMFVLPFGDNVNHPKQFFNMALNGNQAISMIEQKFGAKYDLGTYYDTFGLQISGDSISWVKKTFNVPNVYAFYLKDKGKFGYALPSSEIKTACEEAMTGMLEVMTTKPRSIFVDSYFTHSSGSGIVGSLFVFCFNLVLVNLV